MVFELPTWNGWTIDEKLQQFRKVEFINGNPSIKFIEFDSEEGERMFYEYSKENEC